MRNACALRASRFRNAFFAVRRFAAVNKTATLEKRQFVLPFARIVPFDLCAAPGWTGVVR
jgi:hypothetical protein